METEIERGIVTLLALRAEFAVVLNRYIAIETNVEFALTSQTELRSELAAIAGRCATLEAKAQGSQVGRSGLEAKFAKFVQRLDSARLNITDTPCGGVVERVDKIDRRTKLFLTHVSDSLLILKEGEYISDTAARNGFWDKHIMDVIDEVAGTRPSCAVDVGAHLGLLTVVMAKRFARVFSFEQPIQLCVANR